MPHDTHTTSARNQDLDNRSLDYYQRLIPDWWKDPWGSPVWEQQVGSSTTYMSNRIFNVVREDLIPGGSKQRFGDLLIQTLKTQGVKELVYVAPRYGYAGIALAHLAKTYDLRLTLFMPACKEISKHQAIAISLGAEPIFYRIAAMPNLNKTAKEYAESRRGASFIPLGLKHELVTAVAVRTAFNLNKRLRHGNIEEMWTAMSTGVLSRALQIALPQAKFHGVAVARNIQDGERGRAEMISSPYAFPQDAKHGPTKFPSAANYDAKCWEAMLTKASNNAWFWNVAGDDAMTPELAFFQMALPSEVEWGKMRTLRPGWRSSRTTQKPIQFSDI